MTNNHEGSPDSDVNIYAETGLRWTPLKMCCGVPARDTLREMKIGTNDESSRTNDEGMQVQAKTKPTGCARGEDPLNISPLMGS